VISNLVVDKEKCNPFRKSHQDYLKNLKNEGRISMAGRFVDGKGGLYIIIAADDLEAKRLVEADPYHSNGLRTYNIIGWERKI
jgi:uncharacterized protein YciI